MNAATHQFAADRGNSGLSYPAGLGRRWAALSEAGKIVAMLAQTQAETPSNALRDFPRLIADCEAWRQDLAERSVSDLAAMMEPGLSALMAINARGQDCQCAARALWLEYSRARHALVSLLPPIGAHGPRRSA